MNIELFKKLRPYIIVLMVAVSIVEIVIYSNLCLKKDLQKAKDYFIAGDYSRAAAMTAYLLDGGSEYTEEIYLLSADIYLEAQDYNGAKEILEKAIENGYDSEEIIQKNNSIIISNESIPLKLAKDFHPFVEESISPFLLILWLTLGLTALMLFALEKYALKNTELLIEDDNHIDEDRRVSESFIAECNGYVEKQAKKEIEEEYRLSMLKKEINNPQNTDVKIYEDVENVQNPNQKTDEWIVPENNNCSKKQDENEIEKEQKILAESEIEQIRKKTIKIVTNTPKTNIKKVKKDKKTNVKLVLKPKKIEVDYEKYHTELLSNPKVNKSYVKLIEKLQSEGLFEIFIKKQLQMDYNFVMNKIINKGNVSIDFLSNYFKTDLNTAKLYLIILQETGVIEKDNDYNKPRKTLLNKSIDITLYRLMYQNILKEEPNEILKTESQEKNKPEDILNYVDSLTSDGWEFEKFCADLLLKNDFIKAEVTSGSNDYGVDVVATDEHGVKYAIQCKCYSHTLNNSAVQEVIAGQSMYNCQVAVVMTNQYFTDNAETLADKNNVLLWDRNKLIEFIENANKNTKVE